jgi:hypothetical protein
MNRNYVNAAGSGTVTQTPGAKQSDFQILSERIMMIAERLVAAEKEIKELKEAKTTKK